MKQLFGKDALDCGTGLTPIGRDNNTAAPDGQPGSIYDLYRPVKRWLIVLVAFVGFMLGFCGTIYQPGLQMVANDLHIGQELVAETVSIYYASSGLGQLVWGPASNRFGRMPIYAVACVGYIGSCLGCMFAPGIQLLLLFRALQGSTAAAFLSTAPAILADVVPPEARGRAAGLGSIAVAIGMLVTPVAGGGLCHAFGWRSTFAALAILCFVFGLGLLLIVRQETHQYLMLQRLAKRDPNAVAHIAKWDAVMSAPPKFVAPWIPIKHNLEPKLLSHTLHVTVMWGVLSCFLIEVLPATLALPPYNLSPELIGVALLVDSIPTLIATPLGGYISDRFATRGAGVSSAWRLVPNTLVLLALGPGSTLGAGWALQYKAHIAVLITTVGATTCGGYFYYPSLFSYITTIKQSASGAASAGAQSAMTVSAAAVVMMTAAVRNTLGYGWWFSILAAFWFVLNVVAYVHILWEQRALNAVMLHLPPDAVAVVVGSLSIGDAEAGRGAGKP